MSEAPNTASRRRSDGMPLKYVTHEKISLRQNSELNEKWLHDRICDDPTILGLGDVRVIDRERAYANAGRLDLLLFDEDNNRRYEVEVMLGATDPSHIIRTIEYWDIERRRYPAYEHVAVLIAEDITARFLNVMSLLAGSVPLVAIQLNALRVGESILLDFVQVLDQADLRVDDTEEDAGGGEVDRAYWNQRVGAALMQICDQVLAMINEAGKQPRELNYLRGYIGLRSNGVVQNIVWLAPKPTKKVIHISFRSDDANTWKQRLEEAGVAVNVRRDRRVRITVTSEEFQVQRELIREAIGQTVKAFDE